MSQIKNLIIELKRASIDIYLDGTKLKTRSKPGALNAELAQKIRHHREELIELLREIESVTSHKRAIGKRPENGRPIASYAQKRLWFIEQLYGPGIYNIPMILPLHFAVSEGKFRQALNLLVERHEILRTNYEEYQGELVQIVNPESNIVVNYSDISTLSDDEQEAVLSKHSAFEASKVFDLTQGPVLRGSLFRLKDDAGVFVGAVHHIAFDAWSTDLFNRELIHLYNFVESKGAELELEPLAIQYVDYAAWQQDFLKSDQSARELSYWRDKLAGLPRVHDLPLDLARPAQQTFHGKDHVVSVDAAVGDALMQLATSRRVTLFMLMQAVLSVLLSRYSGADDIVLGTPIAGRNHHQLEGLIGLFVNTLVLRNDTSGNPTFVQYLERVRQTSLDAFKHQDVPFDLLVEKFAGERDLAFNPLFQIMFSTRRDDELDISALSGLVPGQEACGGIAKFDLSVDVTEAKNGLVVNFNYNTDLFYAETIKQLAASFVLLLEQIAGNAELGIRQYRLQNIEQEQFLIQAGRGSRLAYDATLCMHELFEATVERRPDKRAITYNGDSLTYRELNEQANRLARYLVHQGVEPDSLVGIFLPRGIGTVIAILAVLKAGGAYVPIDSKYPSSRVAYLLDDAGVEIVLTESALLCALPEHGRTLVCLDDQAVMQGLLTLDPANLPKADLCLTSSHLAYVIYTSGSTGNPKGVMIEHRSVVNLANALTEAVHAECIPCVRGWNASLSFDASVDGLLGLFSGVPLVIVPDHVRTDPAAMLEYINANGIDMLDITPTQIGALLEHRTFREGLEGPLHLEVGGEEISDALWQQLRGFCEDNKSSAFNLYGPTECTVNSTIFPIMRSTRPQLGSALGEVDLLVLDDQGQVVPAGMPGELCIGGAGLARGYLNRPKLTAERFVVHPLDARKRTYRTGDIVRWRFSNQSGPPELIFMGRTDDQVKVRGYRIELGEVRNALEEMEQVSRAVVRVIGAGDDKRIVAYVKPLTTVPEGHKQKRVDGLKDALRQHLPDFMIPANLVLVEDFPLTMSGKVDVKALPTPQYADVERAEYEAPQTELECALAKIWQELLQVDRIGLQDNFFALGGHSLLIGRMTSAIRARLALEVPIKLVFEAPSLGALARSISELNVVPVQPDIESVSTQDRYELSSAQKRMWFIHRLASTETQYNIPFAFAFNEPLQVDALERGLITLLARHEVLRTTYHEADGEVWQEIRPAEPLKTLELIDLSGLDDVDQRLEWQKLVAAEESKGFDLADTVIRMKLVKMSGKAYVLYGSVHHIAADGLSITEVLRPELMRLYRAYSEGLDNPLPHLPIRYVDYAAWQQDFLNSDQSARELSYWRDKLAGLPRVHDLPLDLARPAQQTFHGKDHVVSVDAAVGDALMQLATSRRVTLFMLMQAVLSVLLSRYSGADDIVLGTPIAGRNHHQLEGLIGLFVNTLVLRNDTSGNPTFVQYLERVRQTSLDAFKHQDVPFDLLVEKFAGERDLAFNPLFQIMFSTRRDDELDISALSGLVPGQEACGGIAKFDLSVDVTEAKNGLVVNFNYNTDLFYAETIKQLAASFVLLLEQIAGNAELGIRQYRLQNIEQEQFLIQAGRGSRLAYDATLCMHELFEATVERRPDKRAITYNGDSLTYRELNEQANRLARYLVHQGVEPDSLVGIFLPRGIGTVIAILAVLKAGGAYVPIDSKYPSSRVAYLLDDAGVEIVLTESALLCALPEHGRTLVCLDDQAVMQGLLTLDPANLPKADLCLTSSHLAYVIYTSGSTGNPKGVMIEHRSVVNLANALTEAVHAECIPCVRGWNASLSFDASVDGLLGLFSGVPLVIVPDHVRTDPAAMLEYINANGIDMLDITPTQIGALLEHRTFREGLEGPLHLEVGGEEISDALWQQLRGFCEDNKSSAFNLYGPTECTVNSTIFPIMRSTRPQLGSALGEVDLLVLDDQGQVVPAGMPGELCIGGAGLARGYLNRPKLTAERFVVHPLDARKRTYRTGDIVRWRFSNQSGPPELIFMGRTDDQVKVRGYRIELGEVRNALEEMEQVSRAVVRVIGEGDDKRIVAYVKPLTTVPEGHKQERAEALKDALRKHLPDFMIPANLVLVEDFPLTMSGKVDVKALPTPQSADVERAEYEAPQTELECALAKIWQELLPVDRIGLQDNFFALGGHSLMAIRLATKIERQFKRSIPISAVFQATNLKAQARMLTDSRISGTNRTLVKMRDGNKRNRAIIFVPGLGGFSHVFAELSRALSRDHPHYAVNALGTDGASAPHKNLSEAANYHVNEIVEQISTHAEIALVGHSMGSALAVTMAEELQQRNRKVSQLFILDGDVENRPTSIDELAAKAQASLLGEEQKKLLSDTAVKPHLNGIEAVILAQLGMSYSIARETIFDELVVVQSAENESIDLSKRWSPHCKNDLYYYKIPGGHNTMLRNPYVGELCKIIEFHLS